MSFETMQATLRQIITLEKRIERLQAEPEPLASEPRAYEKRVNLYSRIQVSQDQLEDLKHELHLQAVACGVADYNQHRYGVKTIRGPLGNKRTVTRKPPTFTSGGIISAEGREHVIPKNEFSPEQVAHILDGLNKAANISKDIITQLECKPVIMDQEKEPDPIADEMEKQGQELLDILDNERNEGRPHE